MNDQKNQKHPCLSFAQYLETGGGSDTKCGANVSKKVLLSTAKENQQRGKFKRLGLINSKPQRRLFYNIL